MPACLSSRPPPAFAPAPNQRAKYLRSARDGGPSIAPVLKLRHPRRHAGRLAVAETLDAFLKRRGISRVEVSEDLDVSENLIAKWVTGIEAFAIGDLVAIQNERLALAIWDEVRDLIRNR